MSDERGSRGAELDVPVSGELRAEAIALGAEWDRDGRVWRAGSGCSSAELLSLSRFAATGESRVEGAVPSVSRKAMALAAADETVRAGGRPARTWLRDDPAPSDRLRLWAVPGRHGRFSAVRLDAALAEAGLDVGIEDDAKSPAFGQRYVASGTSLPESVARFSSPEAEIAVGAHLARRSSERALAAEAANSLVAGPLRRPLRFPARGGDEVAAAWTAAAFKAASPARRAAFASATRTAFVSAKSSGEGLESFSDALRMMEGGSRQALGSASAAVDEPAGRSAARFVAKRGEDRSER